ncbi:MAG TPA: spore coat U domain-containing protein [Candidatus Baltobacteraceae bacterium]|jgi:spore coat protein U-like protein
MSIRMSLRAAALVAIVALASAPLAASAGTATNTLSVTASVAQNCTIGASTMAFGSYDPVVANLSTNLDQTSTIRLTCTKNASGITLGFGASANAPGGCTTPARCMISGSDYLQYQIYSDSGHSNAWTSAIAETVTGGTTTPTDVTIYGRIPSGQDAAVGASYADSVTATVNF